MQANIRQWTILLCLTGILLGLSGFAWAGVVTNVTVFEKAGVTTNNYPLTFGHVFKKGDVPQSVQVTLNGQILPAQFDIKRHWDDGSVKHGVISVIIPQMPANGSVNLVLETNDDPNNSGAMDKGAILATNVESRIDLTGLSGSGYSGNASAFLKTAINDTANLEYWLQGPVCTEILVNQRLNNSLNASWEARFYPGTNFGVRVSNSIENMDADYRGNINYAVSILTGTDNLTAAYSKPTFQHNESSRWRKVLWIGPEPPEVEVHYNLPYLISTGSIMNYDASLQVPETVLAAAYSAWQSSDHDIMGSGTLQTYFPSTGGREDIGILPTWTARYLISMDNRMREIMLINAEMSSSCPIHYRESNPDMSFYGSPVSIDDRPGVRTTAQYAADSNYAPGTLPPAIGDTATEWTIDRAHQGSFAFIPYLITGEKYYLDEMIYWAAWDLSQSAYNSDWGRDYSKGLIRDQVRGEAWAIRNIADAAAFSPDNSLMTNYLTDKINNNISQWMEEKDRYPLNYWGIDSYASTSGMTSDVRDVTSPWMEDFMLLALAHMKELGFSAQQILDWYGTSFTINRFTHPDFNHFNGAPYRFPARLTDGTYPQTWAEANSKFIDQPTAFPTDDYPYSYRFIAMAATSCLLDYPNGEAAYQFLKNNVQDQNELNEDPTWAIIPRTVTGQSSVPQILNVTIE